jgi:hypothetical protein
MAGTRTAPEVDVVGSNLNNTTLHFIDASGDQFTDTVQTVAPLGLGVIEGYAAAYQAATQASLWKVTVTNAWYGEPDPDNAEALYRGSVKDGVNLLFKNGATLNTQSPRLIAPIAGVMQGNQDIPLLTAAEFTALIGTYQAMLAGYDLLSAQFTERRERTNNPRIKA